MPSSAAVRRADDLLGTGRVVTGGPTVTLTLLPGGYAVCRLPADAVVPLPGTAGGVYSVTRTRDELSVVCAEDVAPDGATVEPGWVALVVEGPLDFGLTGILASVAAPLAGAGVSIFAISTYDTDYVLIRRGDQASALAALRTAGHTVRVPG